MNETEITALFVRLTSSIGLLPYIAYIIVFLFHKDEYTLSFLVKFQLCMSCLVYSGSYLFPKIEVDSFFCKIQALLNTFSDLSVLAIATSIVFVAQIGFSRPIELESKKRLYFILSLIFCWIVPISVSIFSILYGGTTNSSEFCWIAQWKAIFIFIGIRSVFYIIYYIIAINLLITVNNLIARVSKEHALIDYKALIQKNIFIVSILCVVFVIYVILDVLMFYEISLPGEFYIWLVTGILDCLSRPCFVLLFSFDKGSRDELIRILTCKKEEEKLVEQSEMVVDN